METTETYVARAGLLGLLAVEALLGYEWLMSGITKVVRGGFPSGLADEVREKSEGAASWYASFLDSVVIPNGSVFGVLIIIGELAVGAAMIAAAVLWAFRWERLGLRGRTGLLTATVVAAIGGIFMNLNFHLANGSAHPWLIPGDGFDEGVDLDSFMPAVQVILVIVSVSVWRAMRQPTAEIEQPNRRARRASADQGTANIA